MTSTTTNNQAAVNRIVDIDACRVTWEHRHTIAETRGVDYFAGRRGVMDLALFKRVHCSPAARKKSRRDWGVDPIWTDSENSFGQMYWLRRRRFNTRLRLTTADVTEPNITELRATLLGLVPTDASQQCPYGFVEGAARPRNIERDENQLSSNRSNRGAALTVDQTLIADRAYLPANINKPFGVEVEFDITDRSRPFGQSGTDR